MARVFWAELAPPRLAVNLEVGSGLRAQQTALIRQRFEPVGLDNSCRGFHLGGTVRLP
jgi:hypothetical protein